MSVRGELALEIDELAIEARVTIVPDANGPEITAESIVALLREKGAREGIDTEAIEKGLRAALRKKGETVSFVAAAGTPPTPRPARRGRVRAARCPAAPGGRCPGRPRARPRAGLFRERVEKVRVEKRIRRKPALAFLPSKEEVQVAWEKKTVREPIAVDPAVRETGYLPAGEPGGERARRRAGARGQEHHGPDRSRPAGDRAGVPFRHGARARARRGEGREERLSPQRRYMVRPRAVRDDRVELAKSADGLTCLLSLEPGDSGAPPPDPSEILARAEALGCEKHSLVSAAELAGLLGPADRGEDLGLGGPHLAQGGRERGCRHFAGSSGPGSRSARGGAGARLSPWRTSRQPSARAA